MDKMRKDLLRIIGKEKPQVNRNDLANVLYMTGELGMWPDDVDRVSEEQAIMCWRIIEKCRVQAFPKDMRL